MATLGTIDLGTNTRWLNEFEGSAIINKKEYTEEGRLFVFQSQQDVYRELIYDCGWQTYAIVNDLKALRDAGTVAVLTHNDNRTFNVLLDKVEAEPVRALSGFLSGSKFAVKLKLIEV